MSKFIQSDPGQRLLLPVDLSEWVPADDLSHFILAAVQRVSMDHFVFNERGTGSAQYHPRMLLGLLIYCYANGVFGSRRIERATYRDIGARYVTADRHPDHDTICKFRRDNEAAIQASFVQVLQLARELKLLRLGIVSVDGTKLEANASKHRSVRYDRAKGWVGELRAEVKSLLLRAAKADEGARPDGQSLPQQLRSREALAHQLQGACERLEAEAKADAEAQRKVYEDKVRAREQRPGKRKGKKIKPPEDSPKAHAQINLTDPDSGLMRKNKSSEYRQSYNAQAVVDAQGSQLVVAARVSRCASDRNELVADVDAIPRCVGTPSTVLADNGFAHEGEVKALQGRHIEVLVAVGREGGQRRYDLRPPTVPRELNRRAPEWYHAMRAQLDTPSGRARYRLRQHTVEPVFGIIKQVLGFRRFMLRGHQRVENEWRLVCLAYNMKRLHRLHNAMA